MAPDYIIRVSGQLFFYDCLSTYCNFSLVHNFKPKPVLSFCRDIGGEGDHGGMKKGDFFFSSSCIH